MAARECVPKVIEDRRGRPSSKENTVRSFMTRHPVASFLALFYGLGWAAFIPSLLGNQGFGILKTDIPLDPFRLLSVVFFALVPFIATRIVGGPGSVGKLFGQVRHIRVGPQWYLVAFFGPAAALFVVAVLLKGAAPIQGLAANIAGIPTAFMLGIVFLALLGNLWEETSWSGFVTARLQARHGPLKASLMVAPLFGLYHLPLFFIIGGLSDSPDRLPIAQLPLYATFLLIVFSGPMRILLTWIYNATGHSIPVVALFHASINATGGAAILAMYFAGIDGVLIYAALAVFALIVVIATHGRLGLPRTDGAEVRASSLPQPAVSPSIS
jgi:membrane protease YdiL (CAAX protease family)